MSAEVNVTTDVSYQLQGSADSTNPADSTTYYFGAFPQAGLLTAYNSARLWCTQPGTITAVFLEFVVSGTLASAETFTTSIRLNDTTDTTITTSTAMNNTWNTFNNTGLSIAIAQGDSLVVKLVTPAWATNPTAVFSKAFIQVDG